MISIRRTFQHFLKEQNYQRVCQLSLQWKYCKDSFIQAPWKLQLDITEIKCHLKIKFRADVYFYETLCLFMRHFIFCTSVKMEEHRQFSTVSIAEKSHEESTFYSTIMQEKIWRVIKILPNKNLHFRCLTGYLIRLYDLVRYKEINSEHTIIQNWN